MRLDEDNRLQEQELACLMQRYQQADRDAACELVKRLSPSLFRFLAGPSGNQAEADDMLQEVWLRIHRMRHTYRPGEPLLPWIYAIARRVRVDGFRKRARSREVKMEVLPEPAVEAGIESRPQTFDEMIAHLPASQREVLTMLKVEGLSIEEIARSTSSTIGAVKQKAHRAYDTLRGLLPKALVNSLRKAALP